MKGFNTRLNLTNEVVNNNRVIVGDKLFVNAFIDNKRYPEIPIDLLKSVHNKYYYDSSRIYSTFDQFIGKVDKTDKDMVTAIFAKENIGYRMYNQLFRFISNNNILLKEIVYLPGSYYGYLNTELYENFKDVENKSFMSCINYTINLMFHEDETPKYKDKSLMQAQFGTMSNCLDRDGTLLLLKWHQLLLENAIREENKTLLDIIREFVSDEEYHEIESQYKNDPNLVIIKLSSIFGKSIQFINTQLYLIQALINIYAILGILSFLAANEQSLNDITDDIVIKDGQFINPSMKKYNDRMIKILSVLDNNFKDIALYVLNNLSMPGFTLNKLYKYVKGKYIDGKNKKSPIDVNESINFIRSFSGDSKIHVEKYFKEAISNVSSIKGYKKLASMMLDEGALTLFINNAFLINVIVQEMLSRDHNNISNLYIYSEDTNSMCKGMLHQNLFEYIKKIITWNDPDSAFSVREGIMILLTTFDTVTGNFFADSIVFLTKMLQFNYSYGHLWLSSEIKPIVEFKTKIDQIIYQSLTLPDIVELDKAILINRIRTKSLMKFNMSDTMVNNIGDIKISEHSTLYETVQYDNILPIIFIPEISSICKEVVGLKTNMIRSFDSSSSFMNDYNFLITRFMNSEKKGLSLFMKIIIDNFSPHIVDSVIENSNVDNNIDASLNMLEKYDFELDPLCLRILDDNNENFWMTSVDRKLTNALYKAISISNSSEKEYVFVKGENTETQEISSRERLLTYAIVTNDINIDNIIKVYNNEEIDFNSLNVYLDNIMLENGLKNFYKISFYNLLNPFSPTIITEDNLEAFASEKISVLNTVFTSSIGENIRKTIQYLSPASSNVTPYDIIPYILDNKEYDNLKSNFPMNKVIGPALGTTVYYLYIREIMLNTRSEEGKKQGALFNKIYTNELLNSYYGIYSDIPDINYQPLLLYFFPNRCDSLAIDATFGISQFFGGTLLEYNMINKDYNSIALAPSRLLINENDNHFPSMFGSLVKTCYTGINPDDLKIIKKEIAKATNKGKDGYKKVNESLRFIVEDVKSCNDVYHAIKYSLKTALRSKNILNYALEVKNIISSDLYYYTGNIYNIQNYYYTSRYSTISIYLGLDEMKRYGIDKPKGGLVKCLSMAVKDIFINYNLLLEDIVTGIYSILSRGKMGTSYKDFITWNKDNISYEINKPRNIVDISTMLPCGIDNSLNNESMMVKNIITSNVILENGIKRKSVLSDGNATIGIKIEEKQNVEDTFW